MNADGTFKVISAEGAAMKKNLNVLLQLIIVSGMIVLSVASVAAKTPDALFPVIQDGLMGYIDVTGKMIIKPQYQKASLFNENRALVKTPDPDNKTLCIDSSGKVIFTISSDWTNMNKYSEGLMKVKDRKTKMYGYLDLDGNIAIPFKYQSVGSFSEGLADVDVKTGDKYTYGFINKKGEIVIPPDENIKSHFSDGMASVRVWQKDGKVAYGYMDKTGKMVIEPKYKKAGYFAQGFAFVLNGDQLQIIGKDGFALANVPYKVGEFDSIPMFRDGFAAPVNSWRDGKVPWGFLNRIGKVVFPDLNIRIIREGFSEERAWIKLEGSNDTVMIDTTGKVIVTIPDVTDVEPFQNGLSAIQINREKSVTYYNAEGKRVWPVD